MRFLAVVLAGSLFLLGATIRTPLEHLDEDPVHTLHVGGGFDRVRITGDALRVDSGKPIEFGTATSAIEGDSSSVWVRTWDDHDPGTERVGLIADHNGISGVGVFDAINTPLVRPWGPEPQDTIRGVCHFIIRWGGGGREFWVRVEDDSGVEREAFLGYLTTY
jgi:hypothetical protein